MDTLHVLIKKGGSAPGTGESVSFDYFEFESKLETLIFFKETYENEWLADFDEEDTTKIIKKIEKAISKINNCNDDSGISLNLLNYNLDTIVSDSTKVLASGQWDQFSKEAISFLRKDINLYITEKKEELSGNELNYLKEQKKRINRIRSDINKGLLPSKEIMFELLGEMRGRRQEDA